MLNKVQLLASGGEKDLIELIFFVVVAVISIFGSLIGKLLKKDEAPEDDPVFDDAEADEIVAPAETSVDYENTSGYDEQLRERRLRTQLVQARAETERRARFERLKTPNLPPIPKSVSAKKSQQKSPAEDADAELFSDREALRRAVLAQEILAPPLALREFSEPK